MNKDNIDYQVKTDELTKEYLFLRNYGTPEKIRNLWGTQVQRGESNIEETINERTGM